MFKANDYLGDATLNLKALVGDVCSTNKAISINKSYYEKFLKSGDVKFKFFDKDSFWVNC